MNKKYNTSYDAMIDYSTQSVISPLISKFDVKILYLGKNRNGTYLTKQVVDELVGTIGGVPIVGHYDESKKDFLGHGDLRVDFDEDGNVITKNIGPVPYGYIPENPRIWWEKQVDKDGVEREYLCTEAYLWTGRYDELETLKDNQNNQSMELNPKNLDGEWAEIDGDYSFVIKKAEFLGLCILGKNVEPCFEGASFNFSLNDTFVDVLSTMKNELKDALTKFELNKNKEDEFVDNDLDNLEGPTKEELEAIEKEMVDLTLEHERLVESYDYLLEDNKMLKEALAEAQKDRDKYRLELETNKKIALVSEYKEDLTEEEYNNFINNINDYTLKGLELEAKTMAYNNIKKAVKNRTNNFTLVNMVEEQSSGFATESWEQAVADRVRNGGK